MTIFGEHLNLPSRDFPAQAFIGNGSQTSFTLSYTPANAASLLVTKAGVVQEPLQDYVISGSDVSFTSAPANNSRVFVYQLGKPGVAGVPADGSVTTPKIADANVTGVKLAPGSVTLDKLDATLQGNVGTSYAFTGSGQTHSTASGITTVNVPGPDASTAFYNVNQSWSKAQRGALVTLTSSASSVAIDLSLANNFTHTLAENTTLAAPSNPVAGQSGVIVLAQHASSPKTLAYNAFWKFEGGTVPSLTSTAGAIDIFCYFVESGSRATCVLIKDVK